MIRRVPSAARARSFTSYRLVAAMSSSVGPLQSSSGARDGDAPGGPAGGGRPAARGGSGVGAARAAVVVLEADDVVELDRRDLEDRRVLERGDPVHGARPVAKRGPGPDDRLGPLGPGGGADPDPPAPRLDEPRLVLGPVVLEGERLSLGDEEQLAAVDLAERPDELVAPGLVDPPRGEPPRRERPSLLAPACVHHRHRVRKA